MLKAKVLKLQCITFTDWKCPQLEMVITNVERSKSNENQNQ